jgi:hypothetical protein
MAAGTFPNPLFIVPSNENSATTLYEHNVPADVWTVENKHDMDDAIEDLVSMYESNPAVFPFDTIAIESLTHYGDLIVNSLTRENAVDMDQRKWGQFSSHLRTIHTKLTRLEVHLVFTSQATPNDKTGEMEAMIQGRTRLTMPSACDAIGFCEASLYKGEMRYDIHFRRHRGFPARTRYRWVPGKVTNFNFVDLYESAFNQQEEA